MVRGEHGPASVNNSETHQILKVPESSAYSKYSLLIISPSIFQISSGSQFSFRSRRSANPGSVLCKFQHRGVEVYASYAIPSIVHDPHSTILATCI